MAVVAGADVVTVPLWSLVVGIVLGFVAGAWIWGWRVGHAQYLVTEMAPHLLRKLLAVWGVVQSPFESEATFRARARRMIADSPYRATLDDLRRMARAVPGISGCSATEHLERQAVTLEVRLAWWTRFRPALRRALPGLVQEMADDVRPVWVLVEVKVCR